MYGKLDTLAEVLAQIAHFNISDYDVVEDVPDDVIRNVSYICACFLAQHTKLGEDGVEIEVAQLGLQIGTPMTYEDRLVLAQNLVNEYEN